MLFYYVINYFNFISSDDKLIENIKESNKKKDYRTRSKGDEGMIVIFMLAV